MTKLPARPSCFAQEGVLTCDCFALPQPMRLDCVASKQFWEAAKGIVRMKSNQDRREYLGLVARKSQHQADQLRAAAKELIAEAM